MLDGTGQVDAAGQIDAAGQRAERVAEPDQLQPTLTTDNSEQTSIMAYGIAAIGIGAVSINISMLGHASTFLALQLVQTPTLRITAPVGAFVVVCGLLAMTLSGLDLDELGTRRPRVLEAVAAISQLCGAFRSVTVSPVFAIALLPGVYYCTQRQHVLALKPGYMTFCDLVVAVVVAEFISRGLQSTMAAAGRGGVGSTQFADHLHGIAAMHFVASLMVSSWYASATSKRINNCLPKSQSMWLATYASLFVFGAAESWRGLAEAFTEYGCAGIFDCTDPAIGQQVDPASKMLIGVAQMTPAACFLLFRSTLRDAFTRRFQRDPKVQSGASVVEIAQPPRPGPPRGGSHNRQDVHTRTWHVGATSSAAIAIAAVEPPTPAVAATAQLVDEDKVSFLDEFGLPCRGWCSPGSTVRNTRISRHKLAIRSVLVNN
jgi:hypothetical protein